MCAGSMASRTMLAANSSAGLVSAIAMAVQTTSDATASIGDFVTIAPIATEAAAANVRSSKLADIKLLSLVYV
jgi:hypothetical protein